MDKLKAEWTPGMVTAPAPSQAEQKAMPIGEGWQKHSDDVLVLPQALPLVSAASSADALAKGSGNFHTMRIG